MQAQVRRFSRFPWILIGLVLMVLSVVPAAQADTYNAADWAPIVWSDKADYAPGEQVTLTGAHWQPAETVHIRVNDDTGSSWARDVDVTADESGAIVDEFNLPNWFVAKYRVTATGASGAIATHTFTDSNYYVKNASTTPAGAAVSYKIETFGSSDCTGPSTVKFNGTLTGPNAASAQAIDQDAGSVRFTYVGATGGYDFDVWKLDNHSPGQGGATDGDPVTGGGSSSICDTAKNGGTVTYVGFSKRTMQDQTITFAALANRTYGDTDVQLNATASSGLPVSYSASGACSIVDANVRLDAAGSCTVTASQNGNATYNGATPLSQLFTIAKAPLSVQANDASRKYGDDNPGFAGVIAGVKNNDAISATYSSPATPSSNVGTYPIVPQVVATAPVLANYETPVLTNGTLQVTKAPLAIKADDGWREYGDPNPEFSGVITGIKNADDIKGEYSSAATPASEVGSYVIVAKVVATDAVLANYHVPALTNGSLTVTKAPLAVKADDKSRVYGDENPVLTGTLTGVKNADAVMASYSTDADEKSGVGDYAIAAKVVATDAVLANYQVELTDGTLTVTKAPLSVKANDATRLLGAENPGFTGTITGVKNGDAVTASYSTPATTASPVGEYAIMPQVVATAAVLLNYQDPALTNGKLTIVYRWDGFLQPINDTAHQTGVNQSKFKLGQTIPAKFVIKNAAGAVVKQTSDPTFSRSGNRGACAADAVLDTPEAMSPNDGVSYAWDGSQYHYNWTTKGLTAGEYRIYANLGDGTKRFVDICLTR